MTNPLISMYPVRFPRNPPCPSRGRSLVLVLPAFNPRDSLENLSGTLPIRPQKYTRQGSHGAGSHCRRCTSRSDSNWHIIRRKFPRASSLLCCCFIRLSRLLFIFCRPTRLPAPERASSGIVIDICIVVSPLFLHVFVFLCAILSPRSLIAFFAQLIRYITLADAFSICISISKRQSPCSSLPCAIINSFVPWYYFFGKACNGRFL